MLSRPLHDRIVCGIAAGENLGATTGLTGNRLAVAPVLFPSVPAYSQPQEEV